MRHQLKVTVPQACKACTNQVSLGTKALHDKVSRQLIRLHLHSIELGLHGSSLTAAQPCNQRAALAASHCYTYIVTSHR